MDLQCPKQHGRTETICLTVSVLQSANNNMIKMRAIRLRDTPIFHVRTKLPSKRTLHVHGPISLGSVASRPLLACNIWLSTHGLSRRFTKDNQCQCVRGAVESVVHVVVDLPRLRPVRHQLRYKVGVAVGGITSPVGWQLRNEQGKTGTGGFNREVLKASLEFAEAPRRFKRGVGADAPTRSA